MAQGQDPQTRVGRDSSARSKAVSRPSALQPVFTMSILAAKLNLVVPTLWGCSSAGRAPRSQRGGQRFDPAQLHQSSEASASVLHHRGGMRRRAYDLRILCGDEPCVLSHAGVENEKIISTSLKLGHKSGVGLEAIGGASLLLRRTHEQGHLLGRCGASWFSIEREALLMTLTEDVFQNPKLRSERLNQGDGSVVYRKAAWHRRYRRKAMDRNVKGVVEMTLDATKANMTSPLTAEPSLIGTASVSGREGGMKRIKVGAWRDNAEGPMQVVSGVHWGVRPCSFRGYGCIAPQSREIKAFLAGLIGPTKRVGSENCLGPPFGS